MARAWVSPILPVRTAVVPMTGPMMNTCGYPAARITNPATQQTTPAVQPNHTEGRAVVS